MTLHTDSAGMKKKLHLTLQCPRFKSHRTYLPDALKKIKINDPILTFSNQVQIYHQLKCTTF